MQLSVKELAKSCYKILPPPFQKRVFSIYANYKREQIKKLKTPTALTFFITNRCNAQCSHCFYWQELNKPSDELSISEIEKIASSLGHPIYLSLTGGEPSLRQDIVDICRIFNKLNGCRNISIATNGFLPDKIFNICENILDDIPLESFSVQVSIDGLEGTHNKIRRVKNGFQMTMRTIDKLSYLAKQNKIFYVSASITIQKENLNDIFPLIDVIMNTGIPIKFALVRGQNIGTYHLPKNISNDIDPKEKESAMVDLTSLDYLFEKIKTINEDSYYQFWSEMQQEKIKISLKMMREKKKQIDCYAGRIDGVLYANGDVALCELTKPVGNIRDYDYDFAEIWNSEKALHVKRQIQECFCIHGCNLITSISIRPEI